jgi:hypothetical protein
MKLLALTLLAGCVAAQDVEVDLLVLGVSHHFQNREYGYREVNPGVGLACWYKDFGFAAATYQNSYDLHSTVLMPCFRIVSDSDIRYGTVLGVSHLTGYGTQTIHPHVSFLVGYGSLDLHVGYLPYMRAQDGCAPTSATLQLWLSVVVLRL